MKKENEAFIPIFTRLNPRAPSPNKQENRDKGYSSLFCKWTQIQS